VAESDGLENRCGLTPTVGSNPTPSAEAPTADRLGGSRGASVAASNRPRCVRRGRVEVPRLGWSVVTAVVLCGVVLTACGSSSHPTTTKTVTSSHAKPAVTLTTVQVATSSQPTTTAPQTTTALQTTTAVPTTGAPTTTAVTAKSTPHWNAAIFAAETGGILSVSCPSARLCIAVDTGGHAFVSTDPTGGRSAWKWVTVPGASSGFGAVSCPEVKLCVAIAQDNVLTTTDPTGGPSTWKSVDVGNALMGQGGDEFEALSCASASLCLVGDVSGNVLVSTDPTGAASTWKVVDADARASNAGISALSCPSTHFCVAGDDDGNILTTSDPRGGPSAWKMVTPAGSTDDIHTLSCPSTHFCMATGSELLSSTNPAGGASAWYSTSGVINDDAEAVTCHNLHLCLVSDVALDLATSAYPTDGLAAWANIYSAPNGPGNTMGIGLSCPAVDLCVVTGDNDILTSTSPSAGAPAAPTTPTTIPAATTITASVDTAGWREANFPSEENGIVAVSCPSPGLCVAVDNGGKTFVSTDPAGGSTSAWKISVVAGATSGFSGVSCPDVELCVGIAGGNIVSTTDPTGGGAKWKSLDAGNALMGQGGDEFVSVSCPSPTLCLVADINGNVLVSTNPTGPASAWKASDVDAAAASPEVTSLSCPSAHFCVAGDDGGHILTTTDPTGGAEAWKMATPAGSSSSISSVSCPSTSFCLVASDQLFISADPAGGGTAWKEVSGVLNGDTETVACASSTVCVASDVALDLATSSNPTGGAGAWTSSYVPPDSPRNSLGIGLSCAGVNLCVATGDDDIISSTRP
jgi:hypothetical protein